MNFKILPMPEAEDIAKYLNSLSEDKRGDFIATLKDATDFCWKCGHDYRNSKRVCYCEHDD